jgi:hypothetical protein
MSVIPGGLAGALAGAPLAQTKGSEIERTQQDVETRQRLAVSQAKAADAAEIAAADGEDTKAEDRDADGRRFWERPAAPAQPADESVVPSAPHQVKDPHGESGGQLDLTG